MINNALLKFIGEERNVIIGQSSIDILKKFFKVNGEILVGIKEAIGGRDITYDKEVTRKEDFFFFKIKIVPTTFEDGRHGATIILKNITDQKIAENVLNESKEKFINLLKKMEKK
jgi:hypothetical protein